MLQKDSARRIGALKASEQEDALETERHGDDRREEIELGAILVDAQLRSRLVAVDVARIRPELREAGADGTPNRKVR